MGQLINVTATAIGHTAVFDLDRSLTGQDGRTFTAAPDPGDPPATLASRLFHADADITSVHILSNTVTISRGESWESEALDTTTDVITNLFIVYHLESSEQHAERLREEHYNATITHIRAHNPELWVLRVKPDEPIDPFKPGQYTTLGLGYWEPRADEAHEDFVADPAQEDKVARRSYSVSSSVLDDAGELVPPHPPEVEFYIVQVPPGQTEIPALTPRMFMKGVGDRIFMGRKFTGRYTLDDVKPGDNVVFLSTGTGEAPQNLMMAELFRNGHDARIISVVCVRRRNDLAYVDQQATLTDLYSNYRYVTLTTREPENEGQKVYIQDYIESGELEKTLGAPLDPADTHVFLCGNPAMIGLPRWDDQTGELTFPEVRGVCQILHERGFTIDHRKERGNVHYEEYWTDR